VEYWRYLTVILVLTLLNCVTLLHSVRAEDAARDYYAAGGDRAATQALHNLDRFHYQPAVKHLQDRKYRFALGDLEFMLKYFPNHPQALAKMAELALALKRPDIADQRFKDAIARYPKHDETYVIYGTFLQRLGRVDAAISEYEKALEMNPNSAYAQYNLGLAYVDRKEYREANVYAQKAYQLGIGFPALKEKLQAVGAWKPVEDAKRGAVNQAPNAQEQSSGKAN
jgi:tetratricopeptide (TPR) repeat protein